MKKRIISVISVLLLFSIMVIYVQKNKMPGSITSFFAMDTYMSISATGKESQAAVKAATDAIHKLDKELSVTDPGSDVYKLNDIKIITLSEDLDILTETSLSVKEQTDGAFDICIYPIMREWGFTTGQYNVPGPETLKHLCEESEQSEITIDREQKTITLSENTEIDFGGIAKGYASKKARDILTAHNIKSGLINLGGNVYALGYKPDGQEWKVAIKDPIDSDKNLGILSVHDKAVITSGGYERYFEKDSVRYHHIIDPKTGYPANSGVISVTIISEDPTLADALSTALYVMGYEKASDFWKDNSDLFDLVICDDLNRLYISEGVKDDFSSELKYEIVKK